MNDIINDKNEELLNDATAEGVSNCCGAKVYMPDICSDCKEHCAVELDPLIEPEAD